MPMWPFSSHHSKEKEAGNVQNRDMREIDYAVSDVYSWWRGTFIFIQRKQIKTWKGVAIIAFVAGVFSALIWVVSIHVEEPTNKTDRVIQNNTQR